MYKSFTSINNFIAELPPGQRYALEGIAQRAINEAPVTVECDRPSLAIIGDVALQQYPVIQAAQAEIYDTFVAFCTGAAAISPK